MRANTTLVFADWEFLQKGTGEEIWNAINTYSQHDPTIIFKQETAPFSDYPSKISSELGAKQGPDLLIVPDTSLRQFQDAGLLESLDGVVDPADEAKLTKSNDVGKVDGHRYAYSWQTQYFQLMWNPTLLEKAGVEPPTDFASFVATAKAIKEKTGQPGFGFRHQLNEELSWFQDFTSWIYGFGGGWASDTGLTINDSHNIDAVAAFSEIYHSGAFAIGDDASTFRAAFSAGKLGMLIDNASTAATVTSGSVAVPSKTLGVGPLPFPTKGSAFGGSYLAVNANSKNKEAAKKFVAWWLSQDGQKQAASFAGGAGVATDTPPATEYVATHPWAPKFLAQAPYAKPRVIPGAEALTPQIAHVIMPAIESVLVNNVDPKTALDGAQKEAMALVAAAK